MLERNTCSKRLAAKQFIFCTYLCIYYTTRYEGLNYSMKKINCNLPSRSSPKFPQPIFLPTRKFGPTISMPDDELTECLAGYIPLELFDVAPPAAADAPPAAGTPLKLRRTK